MEIELPAGAAMFDSAKSHSTEVIKGESKVVIVELK